MVLDPFLFSLQCISDQFTKLRPYILGQTHIPKCGHNLWMISKLRDECAGAKGDGDGDGDGMAAWKKHTANAEELAEYAKESMRRIL